MGTYKSFISGNNEFLKEDNINFTGKDKEMPPKKVLLTVRGGRVLDK